MDWKKLLRDSSALTVLPKPVPKKFNAWSTTCCDKNNLKHYLMYMCGIHSDGISGPKVYFNLLSA